MAVVRFSTVRVLFDLVFKLPAIVTRTATPQQIGYFLYIHNNSLTVKYAEKAQLISSLQTVVVSVIGLIGQHEYNRLKTSNRVVFGSERINVVEVKRSVTAGLDRNPACLR